jgi:thymidine phosphorylase
MRGTPTVALLTDMNQPLGREVGNADEIRESIAVLRGEGPSDLTELTYALGAEMLLLARVAADPGEGRSRVEEAVTSGRAMEVFAAVVEAQGGDRRVLDDPTLLPSAPERDVIGAPRNGYVTRCDARSIGIGAMRLGAGRERKEDDIDPGVGVTVLAKIGDRVDAGDPLAEVRWNDPYRRGIGYPIIEGAWTIGDEPVTAPPLITGRITEAG